MIINLHNGIYENQSIGWIRASQAGEVILSLPVTAGRIHETGCYSFECLIPENTEQRPDPRKDLTVSVDVVDNFGNHSWYLGVLASKVKMPSGETLLFSFVDHRVSEECRTWREDPSQTNLDRLKAAAKKWRIC